jgi:flagellar basal-body rod modification protein FlgD
METTALSTTTPSKTPASGLPSIQGDYQTFLKMMTTQLRNQDPMEPMKSDQFAIQLATFSGVEQQTQTNALLTQILGTATGQSMAQMAGWVGEEARVAAPVYFNGGNVTLSPNPAADATRAVLVVTDASGAVVDRREMPLTAANYEWDGKTAAGDFLAAGTYALSLESFTGETLTGTGEMEHYAQVQEIRAGANGVSILFPGGIEAPVAAVTALRTRASA